MSANDKTMHLHDAGNQTKRTAKKGFFNSVALLALLATLNSQLSTLNAQGTAFTYQGLLTANGSPVATGNYDFNFNLYVASAGGSPADPGVTNSPVGVTNGLFTTTIDFGGVFTGARYWLEIGSRASGSATAFQVMGPRQEMTPVPYAIYATSAGTATGVVASAVSAPQLNTVGGPSLGQVLSYNGTNLVWITAGGSSSSNAWQLGGNGGTTSANFLGTTDNHPLELRVNNARGLRLELSTFSASNAPSIIGGAVGNFVVFPSVGATIAGGGALNYGADLQTLDPGVSYTNSVTGDFGTVSGGAKNVSFFFGTVGGGEGNTSTGSHAAVGGGTANHSTGSSATVGGGAVNTSSGAQATVAGGSGNIASADYAAVGGGVGNRATLTHTVIGGGNFNTNSAGASVIGGGQINQIAPGAVNSVIGGGYNNHISSSGNTSTIPGGSGNTASGLGCTVGGGVGNTASGRSATSFTSSPATVGGGENNNASGNYSTIPGGVDNSADGFASFAAGRNAHANHDGSFVWGDGTGGAYSGGPNRFDVLATGGFGFFAGSGNITIGSSNVTLDSAGNLNVTGSASVCSLTIRGGCDLAEPFQVSGGELPKGSVVVIDEEHAGHLKVSDQAYDQRVAGIVSGANGVNPGISLSQQGVLEGGQNVALSGRVYVLADASRGSIRPGDLLTTSSTPGHAMKVTDQGSAQGAILGKAMGSLKAGRGMVLVLVTLQ